MNKPTYRQSNLKNYFDCPKKFWLSTNHGIDTTGCMRDGLLFEGYLLGFKHKARGESLCGEYEDCVCEKCLVGRKREGTVNIIKNMAEKVKGLGVLSDGDSYVNLRYESDDYVLIGEADYIGDVLYRKEKIKAIVDVKYTGDIQTIWNEKSEKKDFLQAVVYPYMHYKSTGEILPFIYIVCESKYKSNPIIKTLKYNLKLSDFEWIESFINQVHNTLIYEGNTDHCLQRYGKIRCPYLNHCSEGRKVIGNPIEAEFSDLLEVVI